jgi:hypothetical protein
MEHVTEQDYTDLSLKECISLRSRIETPQGPGSRALFILDEHRRGSWRADDPYEQESFDTLSPLLAERLLELRLSLPELSLSATNQRLLRDILEQQVREGVIDQLILESHVQVFDGPEVVRFQRKGNVSRVTRESRAPGAEVLAEQARQRGAEEEYVTAEGYTRLPERMRSEMGVEAGGMIWFLKDERQR